MIKKVALYFKVTVSFLAILSLFLYWFFNVRVFVEGKEVYVDGYSVFLSADCRAFLKDNFFQEGDVVKKGDLLFKLDTSMFEAKKNVQLAQLKHAKDKERCQKIKVDQSFSKYVLARKELDGLEVSRKKMQNCLSEFEEDQAKLKAEESNIDVINAQIDMINKQINRSKVFSPCNGYIARSFHMPGDVLDAKDPVYVLYEKESFWIHATFNPREAGNLKLDLPVKITLDVFPNIKFNGSVFYIGASDNNFYSKKIPVKISLDIDSEFLSKICLKPGMTGRVFVKIK